LAEADFGSKSEWVVLANVYADLGTWWCITPLIGAGVGFDDIIISSNFQDNTAPVGSHNFANDTAKWNFAWALHAGIAYKVTPNFTAELAYHFLNLGDATAGPMFAGFSPLGAPEGSNQFHHITSHDLTLGVRWLFAPWPPRSRSIRWCARAEIPPVKLGCDGAGSPAPFRLRGPRCASKEGRVARSGRAAITLR